ncbi:class I poly(R)-hydroxyalkanoic acid synthase [Comamonadaceae bacterium M7527]|nr:class I poly(R)-hydroxyalkanoic acid synthase [Comamonadaceae bacterium M7527]
MGAAMAYLQDAFGKDTSLDALPTIDPVALVSVQHQYQQDLLALARDGQLDSMQRDKRFSAADWQSNVAAKQAAATYLINARVLLGMADAVVGTEKVKAKVRFYVQQWIDASAPSNFMAFNAEAQRLAIETKGESIAKGMQNLMADMRQGHVSMTDESVFEVGKNVATSEGAVVFENELFQLIEYKPLTAKVYERPFLLVPPCINKFYILDLQPANSLIRYAVEQGHRTFVVSWRNPDESLSNATWDDYIEDAAIKAINTVQDITGAPTINALGFCVGGTILSTAMAVLAARGEKPVNSVTLLTTLLDFSDTGVLDVFIDEAFVKMREFQFVKGGLLPGADLATTFSFLRPNDLVWNYVVGNYLKGESPPPFDLLYWNGDATNLPGPFYAWYLRNTYLENRLVNPKSTIVCGESIDFRQVKVPAYIYGSREDHIVPIGGAYATTQHWAGPKRFVMGASGHIAGVINPPSKGKRSHWIGSDKTFPTDVQDWIAKATEHKGSWWTDWSQWLQAKAGKQIAAPNSYGKRGRYKAIEPAPGRYVKVKAKQPTSV